MSHINIYHSNIQISTKPSIFHATKLVSITTNNDKYGGELTYHLKELIRGSFLSELKDIVIT